MTQSTTQPSAAEGAVDRLVGGLDAYLRAARDADESFPSIALRLRDEHGVNVSSDSVRRWAIRRGIHVDRKRTAAA